MGVIQPSRVAVWRARRRASLKGWKVLSADRGFASGYWRVVVLLDRRRWEMWYPPDAEGLARAERQLRAAEALR